MTRAQIVERTIKIWGVEPLVFTSLPNGGAEIQLRDGKFHGLDEKGQPNCHNACMRAEAQEASLRRPVVEG